MRLSEEDIEDMRRRADKWLDDPTRAPRGAKVTRETAIGEELVALDVLDLLAERERLVAELELVRREFHAMDTLARIQNECRASAERQIHSMTAEAQRWRPVIAAAKAWRETEALDITYDPFAREHLSAIDGLKSAIDSALAAEGSANE